MPRLSPRAAEYRDICPLSFAQERLWFLDRLWPAGKIHNMPLAYAVTGTLDIEALRRACGEIVRRHEVLRTRIEVRDGEPVQVIDAPRPFRIDIEEPDTDLERRIEEEAITRFDLTSSPMLRVTLLPRTAPQASPLSSPAHALLLTMPHIACDGWSTTVLMRELTTLYAAYEQGRESPLAALPVQYADHAVAQRQRLQGEVLEREVRYWKERLAGAPAVLELPSDRPRPEVRSHHIENCRFTLTDQASARIHALARRELATPFMVLLAAFEIVLARWSGQEDIVVGTPIAGRDDRRLEPLIGCFVNTLALRTDLSGNPTFLELLRRVRKSTLGAYAHQELPFERLVQALQPPRDAGVEPVVQIMVVQLHEEPQTFEMGSVHLRRLPSHGFTHYDLTLHVDSRSSILRGNLRYFTDIFDAETIESLAAHFTRTLEQIAEQPETRIRTLDILTERERHQLQVAWNETRAPAPDTQCMHRLFEAQADRSPDAVAVVDAGQQLTYAALEARANRLARHLIAQGFEPESRVTLCLDRRADMVTAMIAVLKAGGAYVPIDPAWPAERITRILDESRPAFILADSSTGHRIAHACTTDFHFGAVIDIDASPCLWEKASAARLPALRPETPDRAAYVMYTSGSTGTPNGVVVEHRGLVNVLRAMRDLVDLTGGDGVLAQTTMAFDIAAVELLLPLMVGARTIVVDRSHAIDPARLAEAIERHAASVVQATPVMWRMLVEHGWPGRAGLRAICGGEALPIELAARLRPKVARLWNVYGPTETTVWSTVLPIDAAPIDGGRHAGYVSIGGPLRNTSIYILDAAGNSTPVGVAGDLHIGGDGVARGYLNRPAKTAERFVPDPFGDASGARIYCTGDLGRWRRDGTIEFIGRKDSQVKVHGFRIELGEVESHIKKYPRVSDAVVVVREDAPGERRLVAYYVPDGSAGREHRHDADGLRRALAASLPEYMIPSAFVRLDALPLTANGKVDRRALPPPLMRESISTDGYEGPRGSTEGTLACMWAQVLNLDLVGRHDDFFEIGGDSLSALRVVTRIETELRVQLPLLIMFSARTIAELAQHVNTVCHS